jgi:hypothetical protein
MPKTCDDCGCSEGKLHDLFCLRERCPFCGAQLVACGCISKVLDLSPEEQRAVDEYIDDSVEPLKGINERWVKTLNRRGRVPF